MTLARAIENINTIVHSGLLGTNKELDEAMKTVEGYLNGYELKNPFGLSQLETLDAEIQKAIGTLVDCYKKLTENGKIIPFKQSTRASLVVGGALLFSLEKKTEDVHEILAVTDGKDGTTIKIACGSITIPSFPPSKTFSFVKGILLP